MKVEVEPRTHREKQPPCSTQVFGRLTPGAGVTSALGVPASAAADGWKKQPPSALRQAPQPRCGVSRLSLLPQRCPKGDELFLLELVCPAFCCEEQRHHETERHGRWNACMSGHRHSRGEAIDERDL